MNMLFEILASLFVLAGVLFMLIAAVGIVRFPDFYIRMAVVTKAGTLGIGSILLGIIINYNETSILIKCFFIILFILLSSPVAAHIIGKTAALSKIPFWYKTNLKEFKQYLGENETSSLQEANKNAKK